MTGRVRDSTGRVALALACAALAGCNGIAATSGAPAPPQPAAHSAGTRSSVASIYVVDRNFGHNDDRVLVFNSDARGNTGPVRQIEGSQTQLDYAQGIAADRQGNTYVSSFARVTEYAAGASGNVEPIAEIMGSQTGLDVTGGIALDSSANMYVVNDTYVAAAIDVFSAGSNGNVPPARSITGPDTGLSVPAGVAVDSQGETYATNTTYPASVTVYAANANGDATPLATIAGGQTTLNAPTGIAVGRSGKIYVADYVQQEHPHLRFGCQRRRRTDRIHSRPANAAHLSGRRLARRQRLHLRQQHHAPQERARLRPLFLGKRVTGTPHQRQQNRTLRPRSTRSVALC